ncbi:MAG: ECF transporter S component [Christensenellales bacterium]|jgi:riboflavin transporter FmnP
MKTDVRKLTSMALMIALSVLLLYLVHFSIFPAAPYLEYDPADIPIFICAFAYGPVAGLIVTIVASVVQGLTVSAQSGIIGIMMHIFATGSFALIAGLLYKRYRTRKGALLSLGAGVLVMVGTMVIWNLIFTPLYTGMPRQAVVDMLLPIIIPFNLIKAGGNALITFLLYKPISALLKRTHAMQSR